ncbi:MAG: TonB-dependent receptor [Bacteroidia bacterium]
MDFDFKGLRQGLFLVPLFLLVASAIQAQDATLKGKVTDKETAEALIGANVYFKGTTKGEITDIDGKYEIRDISSGTYDLVFSYMGYEQLVMTGLRFEPGEQKTINVQMKMSALTFGEEVVIIGKKPLIDVEQGQTERTISTENIEAAPARNIEQILNTQAGVQNSPTGLHIRGGRTYETGFFIDGVSAKDPLSGNGIGLDLGSNSISQLEITTGGSGVEYGNNTAGVVNTRTRAGGDKLSANFLYKRDNFNFNRDWESVFNQQVFEANIGGPVKVLNSVLKNRLRFHTSLRFDLNDTYLPNPASQLTSSLYPDVNVAPYQDNSWSALVKMNYDITPKKRITATYMKSLTINQDLNMLRITGNDLPYNPGFQFPFMLQPDNASTFTHDANMQIVNWAHTINSKFSYQATLSRFFVHLRGDANGRPWRPEVVNTEFDPQSIVTFPVEYFNPDDSVAFVMAAPGLFNNNGISTLWHDHRVEEYTLRLNGFRYSENTLNKLTFGTEVKLQDLRWVDVTKPWIGAPIELADGSFSQTFRLGEISDLWQVTPATGAFYISDKIKYQGLIAEAGARLEYWFPGQFVDDAVENSNSPIRDEIRQAYREETTRFLGKRFKARLLPKISASFPIKENQVMYFNYGHSMVLPHPSFVYTGLNPLYTDRSTLSFVGNPNLDPETDISYELGLKSQITSDDALTVAAFWKDKYDFITSSSIDIVDVTGREVSRTMRINSDYARIRGIETSYLKRIGQWFSGQLSVSYTIATGQSASASEALGDILNTGNREETREFPLPWDRPWDIKMNSIFTVDQDTGLFGWGLLNHFRFYLEGNFRSGRRYTPYEFTGNEPFSGRPVYEVK